MHPAVAFGAVILGAALFGVAGAFVAVPIAALLLSVVAIYIKTYDVLPQLGNAGADDDRASGGVSPEHRHLGERLRSLRVRSREVAPGDHES